MKAKILSIGENLLLLCVVVVSVWAVCLFWMDDEFAKFIVRNIFRVPLDVSWAHMVFLSMPSLVISAVFTEELAYRVRNWMKKRTSRL